MTAICFYNNGAFDKRAFTMMGLSAKTDEATAIGFFGTGFKYAIATLLRHGCTIRVVAEGTTYDFHSAPGNFRGKEHDFVYCITRNEDGTELDYPIELPFTTHLGANWKLWQAYRELFTNAKDEAGGVCLVDDHDAGDGDINVFVTGDDFIKVYEQHDKYFLNEKSIADGSRMRAVPKRADHDNVVYYKSMYTGTRLDKPTYFTYDYTKTTELTEDRTLADTWYIRHHVGEVWLRSMSYDNLIQYLPKIASDEYYENNIELGYIDASDDFNKAVAYLNKHERPMPMWARDAYTKTLPFNKQIEPYTPTRHQRAQLKRALEVLAHHKCHLDADQITLCTSLPNDVLGYYKYGEGTTIYIAKGAFTRGFEKLLGTLFEEYLHMTEGHDDMSRAMQNELVDRCANLMQVVYEIEQIEVE